LRGSSISGQYRTGQVNSGEDTGQEPGGRTHLLASWLGTSLPGRVVFVAVGRNRKRSEHMTPLQDGTTLYACIIVQELKQVINFLTNREQALRSKGR
jgi:hypothetical protein